MKAIVSTTYLCSHCGAFLLTIRRGDRTFISHTVQDNLPSSIECPHNGKVFKPTMIELEEVDA